MSRNGHAVRSARRTLLRANALATRLSPLARAALAVALLQAVVVLAYVIPGHNARPHGLPVAVVGTSAAADHFIQHLENGGRFRVVMPQDGVQARQDIRTRKVYGAFLLDRPGPRVLTSSAASVAAQQVITVVASQAHVPTRAIRDVVPTTANDPRGVAFNLLVIPLLTTSAIAALLVQWLLGSALLLRNRLFALSGIAAVTAAFTSVIIGPLFNVVPGSFLAKTGLLTLAVAGILLVTDGLVRLVGSLGIALALFVFVIIGSPASGAATARELVPAPWRQIGEVIPPGPIVTALRNTAYFNGTAMLEPVMALIGVILAGVALQVAAQRRGASRSKQPASSSAVPAAPPPESAAVAVSVGA